VRTSPMSQVNGFFLSREPASRLKPQDVLARDCSVSRIVGDAMIRRRALLTSKVHLAILRSVVSARNIFWHVPLSLTWLGQSLNVSSLLIRPRPAAKKPSRRGRHAQLADLTIFNPQRT
jgi:hypothetical protein